MAAQLKSLILGAIDAIDVDARLCMLIIAWHEYGGFKL